jgi:hypothetical protein
MGYSPQECAALQTSEHWKELTQQYKQKAQELYDKATHLTTDDVVEMAQNAVNDVQAQVHSATDYIQTHTSDQMLDDAIETGGAIVDATGEMATDAWDWMKQTCDNIAHTKNLSEAAGMVAAAGIDLINPGKKAGKLYELEQKIERKLHTSKNDKRSGEDGGSSKGTRCGGQTANKNKGDCAERLVNRQYASQGYEIFDTQKITNGSGHGLDNIVYTPTTVTIIETKANTSPMSKPQRLGGEKYKDIQDKAYEDGLQGKGRMKSVPNEGITEYKNLQVGKSLHYKKCRVKLHNDPSGCYGRLGKGTCKAKSIECSDWNPE